MANADLVVVGADASWQSRKAVGAATREARRRGARLLILTVLQWDDLAPGQAVSQPVEGGYPEWARAASESALSIARSIDPSVPVDVRIIPSLRAPELETVIERTQLLVLGPHGRGGQVALSIGSTSDELARRFRTPILLPRVDRPADRHGPARRSEVHVGLSGRGDETELLRVAAIAARQRGSSLRLVRAIPKAHPGERVLHALVQAWESVRATPETAEVPCHVEVAQNEPVTALLQRCQPDDLLVVGTRGGGTLAGLIAGSVARKVLDELPCDVIVVPPGVRRAADPHAVPGAVLQTT